MTEQYPLKIRMHDPETGRLAAPIISGYEGLDPYASDIPVSARVIQDDLQVFANAVQTQLDGIGRSISGRRGKEYFGIGVDKKRKDLLGRETVVVFEASFDLPDSDAPVALEENRYIIYNNYVGFFQQVCYEDFGVKVEERVLQERYMNPGDVYTLKLLAYKLLEDNSL